MSKLKMVDVFGEIVPKYDVPAAVSGDEVEMGTIKWGYWYFPDVSLLDSVVGQEEGVDVDEDEVTTVALATEVVLVQ